jgi:quinolinate synthase
MKHDNTLVLAHYYTTPEVQALADYVGDSLDLSLKAEAEQPKRIIFLGVRFMAETAKILSPESEVIIPTRKATCSLVEQTDIDALEKWRNQYPDHAHVSYINSSAKHKVLSDWIVTSRNVDDIISHLYANDQPVIFSPDRNMGAYLNHIYGYNMPLWSAVCEVHDQFNLDTLKEEWKKWTDGPKYILAHPESPLSVLMFAQDQQSAGKGLIGSTSQMLAWVRDFKWSVGTIYVATEIGLLEVMRKERPDLDIRQAPIYSGCQCNSCPYMKMNDIANAKAAINGVGDRIDYLNDSEIELARTPLDRMLNFSKNAYGSA